MAQSLNLTAGFTGLVSLAHAGFYGIGAYTAALLSTHYGMTFWQTCPLAMLLSGLVACGIAAIALRTTEDYFVICTLGIQSILFSLMNNWMALTHGPLGITSIPSLAIFGYDLDSHGSFLAFSASLCAVIIYLLWNLSRSGFGRVLLAIREDEIYTQSLGKNIYLAKLQAFTLGAMLAAIAGVLYAHYISFIDPTSFMVDESILILSMVIIGGMGRIWGGVGATVLLVSLPEALRFVGLPNAIAANVRQILYGVCLVLVVLWRRRL